MADRIERIKNSYLRALAGKKFRIVDPAFDIIGRPDHEHRESLGFSTEFRLVNPEVRWYERGNVERWDWDAKAYVPCPEFHDADANGHGKYLRPMTDDNGQILRFESGQVKTTPNVRWFARLHVAFDNPVTIEKWILDKEASTPEKPAFKQQAVTFTECELEIAWGPSEKSQYGKLITAIRSFLKGSIAMMKSMGAHAREPLEEDVYVTVIHTPEAKDLSDIYRFEGVVLRDLSLPSDSPPPSERTPNAGTGVETVDEADINALPF